MGSLETTNVVVFGADVVAELADFYFREHTPYKISAFVLDDPYVKEPTFCDRPVLALSQLLREFPPHEFKAFVALGYTKMNLVREEKYKSLKSMGYNFVSYLSPRTSCFSKSIGENCFIFEDNTIQPFVRIGNNVTLWSGNHIGHHSVIEDHCFLTSHVVVSGGVQVGERAFIGVNATIRDAVTIGSDSMIGAGAVVTRNLPPKSVLRAPKSELKAFESDQLRRV